MRALSGNCAQLPDSFAETALSLLNLVPSVITHAVLPLLKIKSSTVMVTMFFLFFKHL